MTETPNVFIQALDSSYYDLSEDDIKNYSFDTKKHSSDSYLILLKNKDNYGFARGNNTGMDLAYNTLKSDYICLLNNDTLVDPNFIFELINFSKTDERIGVLGPRIYYYDLNNKKNIIWFSGGIIKRFSGKSKHIGMGRADKDISKENIEVDYITGCAILIKNSVIKKIGFLDSDYFFFWEDVDYCIKAKKNGFKIFTVPTSKIWHKCAVSTGKGFFGSTGKQMKSSFGLYHIIKNRYVFMKKNNLNNSFDHYIFLVFYFFDILKKISFYFITNNIQRVKSVIKGAIAGIKYNEV